MKTIETKILLGGGQARLDGGFQDPLFAALRILNPEKLDDLPDEADTEIYEITIEDSEGRIFKPLIRIVDGVQKQVRKAFASIGPRDTAELLISRLLQENSI